jgi:hypothetical protein
VPVDVNEMVTQLPRQLDDDYAFNVQIKRHQIHKISYLEGWVNKASVKAWLKYLMQKSLYRNVTIDESFFQPKDVPVLPVDGDVDPEEPLIESISESADDAHGMLLAKQHTPMWSEDKYLSLAPGQKQRPLNIIYEEHAELSFPGIYLGEPRKFKIDRVTPFKMATSVLRRRDRRGVTLEHVLYMVMKIMRLRIADGLNNVRFKNTADRKTHSRRGGRQEILRALRGAKLCVH